MNEDHNSDLTDSQALDDDTPGLYAQWQPIYERHGIPTFPVEFIQDRKGKWKKKPVPSNYLRMGRPASRSLARRYSRYNAFGFAPGSRTRITILDVDSPDEKVLTDALATHGDAPLIWRTGSGHFAAPYRYNGEPRKPKRVGGAPIDLLGGGYAVLPPSKGLAHPYEIIRGSLADLERLPTLRNLDLLLGKSEAAPQASAVESDAPHRVGNDEGHRNTTLWRYCMVQSRHVDDLEALLDCARTRNESFDPPLEDEEVIQVTNSAWDYQIAGRNHIGAGNAIMTSKEDIIGLAIKNPDAYALGQYLEINHWNRDEFVLANALAESLGWTLARFRKARDYLVKYGKIAVKHEGGRGRNDPPIYKWNNRVIF